LPNKEKKLEYQGSFRCKKFKNLAAPNTSNSFLTPRFANPNLEWSKVPATSQELHSNNSTSGDSTPSAHRMTMPIFKDWNRGLARTKAYNKSLHNGAMKPKVVSKFASKAAPKVAIRRVRGSIDREIENKKKLQPIEGTIIKRKHVINLGSRTVFQ